MVLFKVLLEYPKVNLRECVLYAHEQGYTEFVRLFLASGRTDVDPDLLSRPILQVNPHIENRVTITRASERRVHPP